MTETKSVKTSDVHTKSVKTSDVVSTKNKCLVR
jgi:hypothetical protein